MRRNWTEAEERWLSEQYTTSSKEMLIKELGRSWSSICGKVQKMGLKRNIGFTRRHFKAKGKREWSELDKQYLSENYGTATKRGLMARLFRSWEAIKAQAFIQGLNRKKVGYKQRMSPEIKISNGVLLRRWSKEEEKVLRQMYPKIDALKILKSLPNRNWKSIQLRAAFLGIKRESAICKREILMKKLLDEIFPNERCTDQARPKWLVNPKTGKRLELDRYYPNLKIAFEYNGLQHYRPVPFFVSGEKEAHEVYSLQVERDQVKKELCTQYGVSLVIIKYSNGLSLNNLRQIISKKNVVQCQRL